MPFKIDTQTKGLYIVSEDSITNRFFQKEQTSAGLLVKNHYKEIEASLCLSWLIRQGKTVESISAYFHTDEDLKDAPPLEKLLPALEESIDSFTEGAYQNHITARENQDWRTMNDYRYWQEVQDIWSEIRDLRERRYYENEIHHRPGVPRIETIGKRLVDAIIDLVWKLDNDEPSVQEELTEAFRKTQDPVLSKLNPEDRK